MDKSNDYYDVIAQRHQQRITGSSVKQIQDVISDVLSVHIAVKNQTKKLYVWNYEDEGIIIMAIAESMEHARKLVIDESLKNLELKKRLEVSSKIAYEKVAELKLNRYDAPERIEIFRECREITGRQTACMHDDNGDFNKGYNFWLTDDKPFVFDLDSPMAYLFSNNNE